MKQSTSGSQIEFETVGSLFRHLHQSILAAEAQKESQSALASKDTSCPVDRNTGSLVEPVLHPRDEMACLLMNFRKSLEQSFSEPDLCEAETDEVPDYIPLELPYETSDVIYISDDERAKDIVCFDSSEDSEDSTEVAHNPRKRQHNDEPLPERKSLRRSLGDMSIHDASPVPRCVTCHIELTSYGHKLSSMCKYRCKTYCLGCARLEAFANTKMEKRDIISYLTTGKIFHHDAPPHLSATEVHQRIRARYTGMRSRHSHKAPPNTKWPLKLQHLISLYINQKQTCQITGLRCYLHNTNYERVPHWALTFDHITPVSYGHGDPFLWSSKNLQIMSSVMNFIKADSSDSELVSWYRRFLKAHPIEID